LNLATPAAVAQAGRLLRSQPVAVWQAYMRYHLVNECAPWLSQAFFDESFAFDSKLSGARQALPRWKRAVGSVDGAMGEALGKAYVQRAFPPESKQRMLELVDDLVAVMKERIA